MILVKKGNESGSDSDRLTVASSGRSWACQSEQQLINRGAVNVKQYPINSRWETVTGK